MMFELHQAIVQQLPSPALYRHNTLPFFERHLAREGLTLGAFRGDALIAYALVRFPRLQPDNLGRHFGLPGSDLLGVGHLEECGVAPAYRRCGIHTEMTRRRLAILESLGYRYAAVTVAPANLFSLRVQLACGLEAVAIAKKYGGFDRIQIPVPVGTPTAALEPTALTEAAAHKGSLMIEVCIPLALLQEAEKKIKEGEKVTILK